jgi:hypothetical protein
MPDELLCGLLVCMFAGCSNSFRIKAGRDGLFNVARSFQHWHYVEALHDVQVDLLAS